MGKTGAANAGGIREWQTLSKVQRRPYKAKAKAKAASSTATVELRHFRSNAVEKQLSAPPYATQGRGKN
jgi:hypothetical protein